MKSHIKRVLVIADQHVSHDEEDNPAYLLTRAFARGYKPDGVVDLGDLMSWNVVSHFNKQKFRTLEGKRVKLEYEAANKRLDEWQEAVGGVPYTILEGNHDRWITDWIDANPAIEGLVEMPESLKLADRDIEWVTLDEQPKKVGKLNLLHGWWAGEGAAKKHVWKIGGNVLFGHIHKTSTYYRSVYDSGDMQVGHSLGCLTTTRPEYQKARVTDHNHGFGLLYLDPEDGRFSIYNVVILNNSFIIGPRRYSFKELSCGRMEKEL